MRRGDFKPRIWAAILRVVAKGAKICGRQQAETCLFQPRIRAALIGVIGDPPVPRISFIYWGDCFGAEEARESGAFVKTAYVDDDAAVSQARIPLVAKISPENSLQWSARATKAMIAEPGRTAGLDGAPEPHPCFLRGFSNEDFEGGLSGLS